MTDQLSLNFARDPGDEPSRHGGREVSEHRRGPAPASCLRTLAQLRRSWLRFVGETGSAWLDTAEMSAYAGLRRSEVEAALATVDGGRMFTHRWNPSSARNLWRLAVETVDLAEWGSR